LELNEKKGKTNYRKLIFKMAQFITKIKPVLTITRKDGEKVRLRMAQSEEMICWCIEEN
jgi:hypothetical protein